jgi:hypothetical protein
VDKIVAAMLLIIVAIAATIAATQLMNKQWVNVSRVFQIDASDSYITLDQAGTANIRIILRNTGTVIAYVKSIVIVSQSIEVSFANSQAQIAYWNLGKTFTGNASFSNPDKVKIGSAWLTLPPGESAYLTFVATGVGGVMSVGDTYITTIYSYSEGEVLKFRLVVQSD